MPISIGAALPSKISIGNTEVLKVSIGGTEVWSAGGGGNPGYLSRMGVNLSSDQGVFGGGVWYNVGSGGIFVIRNGFESTKLEGNTIVMDGDGTITVTAKAAVGAFDPKLSWRVTRNDIAVGSIASSTSDQVTTAPFTVQNGDVLRWQMSHSGSASSVRYAKGDLQSYFYTNIVQ